MKIENIKYNSFLDFLNDVLLPSGNLYNKLDGFVYRGERTNSYKLLPGALREDQIDKLFGNGKPIDNQAQWLTWQVYAEYVLLREFYKLSNYNGLKVPKIEAISKNYNDHFPSEFLNRTGTKRWLSDDIVDLAALAQHYGVLTRLLDWSYDLYVAIYFASIGAIKAKVNDKDFQKDDTIVIWALNSFYIQFLQPTTSRIPLNFVVPPYHDNPNLNAQKGLLSYWEVLVPDTAEQVFQGNIILTDRTPLNELLQKYCDKEPERDTAVTLLYKFEFPVEDCIAAYEHLRKLGYTAAKLFPGYDGVVKHMDETSCFIQARESINSESSNTNQYS